MKRLIMLTALVVCSFTSCKQKTSPSTASHELKAEDFPEFISHPGTLNIVDFSAEWCPPCKQLKPILASIAEEHSEIVRLGVVDVDSEKTLAAQQGIRGIPDVRFYIHGKQVDGFTGAAPKNHIHQIIAHLVAKHDHELKQANSLPSQAETGSMPPSPPVTVTPAQPEAESPPANEIQLPPGMMRR